MDGNGKQLGFRGKVFRDPVHGLIRISPDDKFLVELINTPEFQRLRRIRQLGVSSYTYPGADHSRFVHSLGVLNFTQRMLVALDVRYGKTHSDLASHLSNNRRLVLAAALLHDLGHGPFSHMIERVFEKSADHEKKTEEIIKAEHSYVNRALRENDIDPNAVAGLIAKESPHHLLMDLISSQLDADRMDYILRDSLATGVKYGTYDAEWILNSLCVGKEPGETEAGDPKNWRLCIEEKRGLYSAEQLIVARMHMSYQVYFHKSTRGWEAHLLCLLKTARKLAEDGLLPPSTPPVIKKFLETGVLNAEDWLFFDESSMQGAFAVWATVSEVGDTANLAELSRAYLVRTKCYQCKELVHMDVDKTMRLLAILTDAGQKDIDWHLDSISFSSYKDYGVTLRAAAQAEEGEDISTASILAADGNPEASATPVEGRSTVLKSLGNQSADGTGKVVRLYYHNRIATKLAPALQKF